MNQQQEKKEKRVVYWPSKWFRVASDIPKGGPKLEGSRLAKLNKSCPPKSYRNAPPTVGTGEIVRL
jgi:hypothetical protein